ncbi:hypothetical protein [Micromonospora sp. NBC_00421]|uniref:hypothetical protein n=1 Tax=Micromonospora sp. NBC_00421 TaxID=2975976 RepID=UPI002E1DF49B
MRRLVSYAAATLATILVLVGLAAAPAQAGPQHYGTDPYASGCAGNSFMYRSFPFSTSGGAGTTERAELWYSRTCQTNWIRVTGNPAGGVTSKTLSSDYGQTWEEYDSGTGWSYGMQVYAPPGVCVNMVVYINYPDGYPFGVVIERVC